MVRYDIEKMLINDEIAVADLPRIWNEKMESYLGVKPTCMKDGVLQDIHWSDGSFGYFPTYALGSANSAQIYHAMKKEVAIDTDIENGDFTNIEAFLQKNVWLHGSSKLPADVIVDTTGEKFDSTYYTNYLISKYSELFDIQK